MTTCIFNIKWKSLYFLTQQPDDQVGHPLREK